MATPRMDVTSFVGKLPEQDDIDALREGIRVLAQAVVKGVSTRKVDDPVRALGCDGISRSEVFRICKSLGAEVRTFLGRPIEAECPYLWLDATFHKVREAGRVVSVATVVAVAVTAAGERTVLGAATGPSEDHQVWVSFLRSLVERGLTGVRLVISDAHEGLRGAIAKVLHGAAWQRCQLHFMVGVFTSPPWRPSRRADAGSPSCAGAPPRRCARAGSWCAR